jgi:hypothetical protein
MSAGGEKAVCFLNSNCLVAILCSRVALFYAITCFRTFIEMMVFDVECSQGHCFEGWFESLEAFEDQRERNLISCPFCDDTNVRKVMSPVALKRSPRDQDAPAPGDNIDYPRLAKAVVDYVHANFEDVGPNFASEALKMHYNVSEKKNIRGSATSEEEKTLKEEGIEFFKIPLPVPVDDKKN